MPLERELATYERELPRLLRAHRGEWVLIHGEAVDSTWPTEDEAYVAGCERFGLEPFLIMPVVEEEKPLPFFLDVRRDAQP